MHLRQFLDCAVYLVVLINPVSKISILSMFPSENTREETRSIVIRSSVIALGILLSFALAGHFILDRLFHVEVYSLKVAGGIVLFAIGYKALSRGVFFETDDKHKLSDMSIVPLASPMIAGPATITASIGFALDPKYGLSVTALALIAAVTVNLVLMLLTPLISNFLRHFNLMGALIRITGLIAATIAIQMILGGAGDWARDTGFVPAGAR